MNTNPDVPDSSDRTAKQSSVSSRQRTNVFLWITPLALRWVIALTLLSAVADRFGLWGPSGAANVAWGDWSHFVAYTAKVNSFLPGTLAPVLAIAATIAEAGLPIALILGLFRRPVAFASTALFAVFAGAMTVSFGVKAPLNFSVFVDAMAAFALAVWPDARHR